MAIFNRFRPAATSQKPAPGDDEEEYKLLARQQQAKTAQQPAPAPVKPVQIAAPRPRVAPAVGSAVAPMKPVAAVPPAPAAVDPRRTIRTEAIKRLEPSREDFKGGGPIYGPNGTTPKEKDTSPLLVNLDDKAESIKVDPILDPLADNKSVKDMTGNFDEDDGTKANDGSGGQTVKDMTGNFRDTDGTKANDGSDARQAAIDEAKRKSDERRRSGEVYDPTGDADLEQVARDRVNKEESDAARADLAAGKAKALMMANARAQLAGMGLSGATAQLEGDIGRTQDRSATLTMAELQRRQRDEGRDDRRLTAQEKRADADAEFAALRRKIAINQLEEDTGVDQDGDGAVAGETPEQKQRREYLEGKIGVDNDNTQPKAGEPKARNRDGSADPFDPNGPNGLIGHVPEIQGRVEIDPGMDVSTATDRDRRLLQLHVDLYFGSDETYDYYESQVDGKIMRVTR